MAEAGWGQGGAYDPPDFGRIEGAAGQRHGSAPHYCLPPSFRKLLTPLKCIRYFKGVGGNTIFAFQEEEKKEEEILI